MELAPHATPRVFWLIRFFLLPPLLEAFDGDELTRIRLDLWAEELAERDESEFIFPVEAKIVEEGSAMLLSYVAFKMRRQIECWYIYNTWKCKWDNWKTDFLVYLKSFVVMG